MWTSRRPATLQVNVAAERERALARRAETFRHAGTSEPPFDSGSQTEWQPSPAEPSEAAEIRPNAVPGNQGSNPEEQPVIKAAAGPKLTPEQRSEVKALVRRELEQNPSVSATAVRRTVERELDISLNHATFHGTYWRKVKAELEGETSPHVNGDVAASSVIAPTGNGAEPSKPAPSSPEEQISMAPGPDGQWRVQVQVTASRVQALRLMQAVVGVLAAEE
jgi:hypothetical protein